MAGYRPTLPLILTQQLLVLLLNICLINVFFDSQLLHFVCLCLVQLKRPNKTSLVFAMFIYSPYSKICQAKLSHVCSMVRLSSGLAVSGGSYPTVQVNGSQNVLNVFNKSDSNITHHMLFYFQPIQTQLTLRYYIIDDQLQLVLSDMTLEHSNQLLLKHLPNIELINVALSVTVVVTGSIIELNSPELAATPIALIVRHSTTNSRRYFSL